MKEILLLSALLFVSWFEGIQGQEDVDKRLEAFISKSLADFPNWLRENGHIPFPLLVDSANFTLTSANDQNEPYYDLTGEVSDRYYHGADKNIKIGEIVSNLTYLELTIFGLTSGEGENDFIEATYSLDGNIGRSFAHGNGKLRRTNQQRIPRLDDIKFYLEVNDEGYFYTRASIVFSDLPRFQNFTLDDLEWDGVAWEIPLLINPVVEAWYMGHFMFYETPFLGNYFRDYMNEIFATTPVEDIVGTHLAPTASHKRLSESPAITHERFYDEERKEIRVKSAFIY